MPVAVAGRVVDSTGGPIAGAVVTLTGDGGTFTATSASDGTYFFDVTPVGTYVATVTPPDGYSVSVSPGPITIPVDSEVPITGQDFVLLANPTLSGRVVAGTRGVPGVVVTVTGARTYTVVTGADGSYDVPLIDPADYDVTFAMPTGYTAVGPVERDVTVGAADVTGVNFALARPGTISGTVTDAAGPVEGAVVTVTGAGGPNTLTTNSGGEFAMDGLPPGSYDVAVTAPAGLEASPGSRPVTITDAGEAVDASFVLTPVVDPGTPGGSGTGTVVVGPTLPEAGMENAPPVLLGLGMLALGVATVLVGRIRSHRYAGSTHPSSPPPPHG